MAIRVDTFALKVGDSQDLHIAQGEDRRYSFSFTPAGGGGPIDFTGMQGAAMSVKDRQGLELFTRMANALGGTPTVLSFDVGQTDTLAQPVLIDRVDITYRDALGVKTQLVASSRFFIDRSESEPGDTPTTPPAIPVVYGLRWLGPWSNTTAYLINDAVQYADPNGGGTALSSFRCKVPNTNVPPVNGGGALSADWDYIAERGAQGPQGVGVAVRWASSQPLSAVVSQIPALGAGAAIVVMVDDGSQTPWVFDVAGRDWSNVRWIGMARADYLGGATQGLALISFVAAPSGGVFNAENIAAINGGAVLSGSANNLSLILKRAALINFGGGPVLDFIGTPAAIYDFDEVSIQGQDAAHPALLLHASNTFPGAVGFMFMRNGSFFAPYGVGHTGAGTAVLTVNIDATGSLDPLGIGANVTLIRAPIGSARHLAFTAADPLLWTGGAPADTETAINRLAQQLFNLGGVIP